MRIMILAVCLLFDLHMCQIHFRRPQVAHISHSSLALRGALSEILSKLQALKSTPTQSFDKIDYIFKFYHQIFLRGSTFHDDDERLFGITYRRRSQRRFCISVVMVIKLFFFITKLWPFGTQMYSMLFGLVERVEYQTVLHSCLQILL